MTRMVVGVFGSRRCGDAARRRLLEHEFEHERIRVSGGETDAAPAPGSSAREFEVLGPVEVLERMFHKLMTGEDEVGRAARAGKCVVALNVSDDAGAAKAAEIFQQVGQRPASVAGGGGEQEVFDPTETLSLLETYPLPNSPADWGEATRGDKSMLEVPHDPGRPEGAIEDAHGLGTDDAAKTPGRGKGA